MNINQLTDWKGRSRVVITGIGAISPLGNTAAESWDAMINGRSGITAITQFDATDLPCRVAGEVKGFEPREYMDVKDARRMSRCSQLAIAAARMAITDARLPEVAADPERTGVLVGTAVGGIERAFEAMDTYFARGLRYVNPFAVPMSLANMPSHHISLLTTAQGPINTTVAACASGTQAIGEAAQYIRDGRADMMFAGGVEGLTSLPGIVGFSAMRGLTTRYNDTPEKSSRPFDKDRDGFVLSEGAGIVILESLEHAIARGATIYAEVLGHASSSDAFHVAAPDPEGAGAVRAMRWALADANLPTDEVSYINAHGPSTPVGDAMETAAIKRLFGERAYQIPVSSNKSLMGHAMGGAGALETIFSTYTLYHQLIPATWNYETPDPECDLDYVVNASRPAPVQTVLKNSFGLGGQNACLVLGRYGADES